MFWHFTFQFKPSLGQLWFSSKVNKNKRPINCWCWSNYTSHLKLFILHAILVFQDFEVINNKENCPSSPSLSEEQRAKIEQNRLQALAKRQKMISNGLLVDVGDSWLKLLEPETKKDYFQSVLFIYLWVFFFSFQISCHSLLSVFQTPRAGKKQRNLTVIH